MKSKKSVKQKKSVEQSPVETVINPKQIRVVQEMFSKVLTRHLENADGSLHGCIHQVFQVWQQLLLDKGVDTSEHFDIEDGEILNSLENPIAHIVKVVAGYHKMFLEAVEDDLLVRNFLKVAILRKDKGRAKTQVNRLLGGKVWA
jgi:hypothetical protein